MKRLLLLTILGFLLICQGCKVKVEEPTFSSGLRPDEPIRLKEIYADTLEFVAMGKATIDSLQTTIEADSLWITLKRDDKLFVLPLYSATNEDFLLEEPLLVDWVFELKDQIDGADPVYSELVIGIKKISVIEEKGTGYKLKHFYKNNLRLAAFYDNNFVFRSGKDGENSHYFDVAPDRLIPSDIDYEEWDTFLAIGKVGIWDFYNELGHIIPGWQMINYYRVFSPLQATIFVSNVGEVTPKNLRVIKTTCLILLPHIEETGEDEASTVIEESFTEEETSEGTSFIPTASDRVRYERETIAKFAAQDIDAVQLTPEERYISFTLYDAEWIFIDTQAEQNGRPYTALLYKVGFIPIIIDIKGNETDDEIIEQYITQASGESKPFPSWKSMMNTEDLEVSK